MLIISYQLFYSPNNKYRYTSVSTPMMELAINILPINQLRKACSVYRDTVWILKMLHHQDGNVWLWPIIADSIWSIVVSVKLQLVDLLKYCTHEQWTIPKKHLSKQLQTTDC